MNTRRFWTRTSDRAASIAISAGGLLMIGSLVLIFGLIFSESLPLFGTPRIVATAGPAASLDEPPPPGLTSHVPRATLAGGAVLCTGDAEGDVSVFEVVEGAEPKLLEKVRLHPESPAPVTVLGTLLGGETLIAGDARGRVSGLMRLRTAPDGDERRLQVVRAYSPNSAPVTAFAASPRGKTFLTGDASGGIVARFGTNARTLASTGAGAPVTALEFGPKGTAFSALTPGGEKYFALEAPHPEISVRSLFGKQLYEGHDHPEFLWQSSGGTDDFESKLSLTPLIFGTLKGTFYALLFAVPVALAAAFYTAAFATPAVKRLVKPVVEIMAGLPSVVLGFLAGLWLAPVIQRSTLATLLLFPMIPLFVLAGVLAIQALPPRLHQRLHGGRELLVIIPLALAAIWFSSLAGPLIENVAFHGDFKGWLLSAAGLKYDARNSLVIAFAMGFAVIPIIFTISEDALSSVPEHLRAASLALGASEWQTAVRVILPTASAGIFSAVMIGFGRAVGETMIVLMATGNTPVMEWSIFNGMRTLSANIAVEISEAPFGGTLYRVLFLAALLLFAITFVVNTLAEVLRQRLRKKYTVI
ncbi:MAG: ABC transporter permease subunit [Acidobacteriota bacterium]